MNGVSPLRGGSGCNGLPTHLEETRHRFVRTTDLNLEEGRLVAITSLGWALLSALLSVVPRPRAAEDILPFLTDEVTAREDGLGDRVLVGAGAAFEPVATCVRRGDGEDVGAERADCWEGEV